jgi:hypothetical protein
MRESTESTGSRKYRRQKVKAGGLLMILALTASVIANQPMVTDIWQQLATDSKLVVQARSSSALGAISIRPAKFMQLIVEVGAAGH